MQINVSSGLRDVDVLVTYLVDRASSFVRFETRFCDKWVMQHKRYES